MMYENLILSYNGEIYNYLELRKELENFGYPFKTDTDTEVFLVAFKHWGVNAFKKFNGMWAAAIYDCSNGKLTLTRDRFGIKPLYYKLDDENFYFASELKFSKNLGYNLRKMKRQYFTIYVIQSQITTRLLF